MMSARGDLNELNTYLWGIFKLLHVPTHSPRRFEARDLYGGLSRSMSMVKIR
jgi:hypothetical protein